jgi:uncharacterized protein (TIGR02147 family)
MNTEPYFQQYLKEQLAKRCERNSRYSVRAFARALRIDVAAMSRLLSGRQVPSVLLTEKLLSLLDFTPTDQERFIASVAAARRTRGYKRLQPLLQSVANGEVSMDLSVDVYRVIADWYHVAILELTFAEGFRSDIAWIAAEIGISQAEAKLAVERLLKLGLLKESDGTLVKTQERLSTADKHLTTPALRKNQRQLLEKAIESLENDPIEDRSMTSMTTAIDPRRIAEAKEMIKHFNRTLCAFLEGGNRTRVYNLGISLYPLQRKERKNT